MKLLNSTPHFNTIFKKHIMLQNTWEAGVGEILVEFMKPFFYYNYNNCHNNNSTKHILYYPETTIHIATLGITNIRNCTKDVLNLLIVIHHSHVKVIKRETLSIAKSCNVLHNCLITFYKIHFILLSSKKILMKKEFTAFLHL